MGWWSADVLGGDTPLDILGAIEDKLGLREVLGDDGGLYPLDQLTQEAREHIALRLNTLTSSFAFNVVLSRIWDAPEGGDDWNIAGQVLAVVIMAVGADMPDSYRETFRQCVLRDEWADEDAERKSEMNKLYALLVDYQPGQRVVMDHTGLFQRINEAGVVRGATELLGGDPGSSMVNMHMNDELMVPDAEGIYHMLRAQVDSWGLTITDEADEKLGDAASAIAEGQDT